MFAELLCPVSVAAASAAAGTRRSYRRRDQPNLHRLRWADWVTGVPATTLRRQPSRTGFCPRTFYASYADIIDNEVPRPVV